MFLKCVECTECGWSADAKQLRTICESCGANVQARYELRAAREAVSRDQIVGRPFDMWRYREVLPVAADVEPVTLGEGGTPLLPANRLGSELGLTKLYVKDEGQNPTGSFKARGMSAAVSMAKTFGVEALAVPSAGNAASAAAAYGARAGLPVHVAMPRNTPAAIQVECEVLGAHVTLIDGNISACGAWVREHAAPNGWFDLSTLKEPYRVEGKKTMGFEVCEQLGWTLPDVILYPTGGGTGLVGMWKAFHEMRELGWLDPEAPLPRMYAVQADGCAPVVEAFHGGLERITPPANPQTIAAGLRVPAPFADRWILRVLHESNGGAVAISDNALIAGCRQLATADGVFAAPEAGTLVAALAELVDGGSVTRDETVILFNTGSGLKYLECFQ
ncbi:MAG: threonine synthase [Planctomycetes bacterium]|jgi:threonine synthase|nr:threonine synthase [Planctomycetota bacterium]MDP6423902.1 threonine synthase [Planctomycetota bacterium]